MVGNPWVWTESGRGTIVSTAAYCLDLGGNIIVRVILFMEYLW